MKSKVLLAVVFLAIISTIGVSQEKEASAFEKKYERQAVVKGYKRMREEERRIFEARKLKLAEDNRFDKLPPWIDSLVGIKGIWVCPGFLQNTARSAGLTEDQIISDVEMQLRLSGIKVNSPEECAASEDEACLFVKVETSHDKDSPFIFYYVSIVFNQEVILLRRPHGKVTGSTWQTGVLGKCARGEFAKEARNEISFCVGMFIDNYRVANPKK